jgi:hypothetical protein
LLQVKAPEESNSAWDLLKVVATIKGEDAFRAESEGKCPLTTQKRPGADHERHCIQSDRPVRA